MEVDERLSMGAIIGISAGCAVAVVIIVILMVCCVFYRRYAYSVDGVHFTEHYFSEFPVIVSSMLTAMTVIAMNNYWDSFYQSWSRVTGLSQNVNKSIIRLFTHFKERIGKWAMWFYIVFISRQD